MGVLADLVDLLLPPRCAACGEPTRAALCAECGAAARGLALVDHAAETLDDGVLAVGAFAYDGVVRAAVRSVKVGGHHGAAAGLGRLMRAQIALPDWPVTWVPSTPRVLRQRGAEIPRLLAGPAARPMLRKTVDARDQTELDARERRRSPLGAFAPTGRVPAAVVLIDDVRTTGTTALAAADALRAGGARRVLVATFAVAGEQARAATAQRAWALVCGDSASRRPWMR